jgi:DedD protein
MRDLDRWKDKVELQLDGRQIFFLFFGSAICACLIFVLGVVVGRRVEAQRSAQAPAAAEDPLAVLDELGNAEEGLTFHSALVKDKDKGGKDKDGKDKAKPAGAPDKAEAPEREDEGGKAQAKEGGKPDGKVGGEGAKAEAKAAEAKGEGKADAKEDKKAAAAAKADKEAKDAKAAAEKDKDKGKSHFTLQLSAFATKGEASDFMRRLRDAGYKPYLIESMIPGKGLMYRVRLGDYTSRDSALSAKSDFERKQKMVAYVAKL